MKGQPAPIDPAMLYPADAFMAIVRWSESTFRRARLDGLKVHVRFERRFILGADAIAYLTRTDPQE